METPWGRMFQAERTASTRVLRERSVEGTRRRPKTLSRMSQERGRR